MSKTIISITIDNSGNCQLQVEITGPASYSKKYPVSKSNDTPLDLGDGIYIIKVYGTSGNKVTLNVKGPSGAVIKNASQPGPGININTSFTVNTAPQLMAQDDEKEEEA
jgi:hypothetical protein